MTWRARAPLRLTTIARLDLYKRLSLRLFHSASLPPPPFFRLRPEKEILGRYVGTNSILVPFSP